MDYFRLCGGTFFTLIVDATQKKPTNGELYKGAENLIKDENLLTHLMRIALPSLQDLSQDDAQNFKQCSVKQSRNLKMVNCEIGRSLRNRIESNYFICHQEMLDFISKFLDVQQKKEQKLVRALLELIEQDKGILPEQLFYVCPDGKAISKRDMSDMIVINIPAFLLGVFLFTLTEITDNSIGKDTYNTWCPKGDTAHTRRYYQGHMGETITRSISFDNSINQKFATQPVTKDITSESKKHPLPRVTAPDNISKNERRYVDALIEVYRERTGVPSLTIDTLNSYPKLNDNLRRHRDDYYYAEELRRGTRDIYSEDGEEYFSIFLEEILTGVIEIFDADYDTGYARLVAVLAAASQTSTEQCVISRETIWIGNHQKKGACHILVNQNKLSGWCNSDTNI